MPFLPVHNPVEIVLSKTSPDQVILHMVDVYVIVLPLSEVVDTKTNQDPIPSTFPVAFLSL